MADMRERLRTFTEAVRKPTDTEIVNRLIAKGVKDYVVVPCSITDTIHSQWDIKAIEGQINLITATSEHSLPAIAAGLYLGTGRTPLIHMQNSGFTNAADGIISLAAVYNFPMVVLVTWRGSNKKDDSEPHQEIGKRTDKITRAVAGKYSYGSRVGHGILNAFDSAIYETRDRKIPSVVLLSPDAFRKETKPILHEEITVFNPDVHRAFQMRYEETTRLKGTQTSPIDPFAQISRDEALEKIVAQHPNAAILFCNGYTARAAQGKVDRLGNFYNTGNMGGTLAIGWGLAISNPNIEVVVVDGDQNAQMSTIKDNLAASYPDNLQWYVLNNGIGASVGVAQSVPLAPLYYDLARVIPTIPDQPGSFPYPRVGDRGAYFDTEEARVMAEQIGALPVHMERFRGWINQQSERNIMVH